MSDLEAALADNRAHAERFISEMEATASHWAVPVRPGKWSPAEVAEHVAMGFDAAAALARGENTGFPRLPFFLRPLARHYFTKILRTERFPKSRTFRNMTPLQGPATPADAASRIRASVAQLEAAFRALRPPLKHPAFGKVDPGDYVRFMGIHTRHHQGQLKP